MTIETMRAWEALKGYIFNYFEQRNWIARKKERRRGGKVEDENKKEKRLRRKGKGQKREKKGDFTVARLANKLLREIKIHISVHRKNEKERRSKRPQPHPIRLAYA